MRSQPPKSQQQKSTLDPEWLAWKSGIEFTRRRAGEYRIVVFPRIPAIATVDKAPASPRPREKTDTGATPSRSRVSKRDAMAAKLGEHTGQGSERRSPGARSAQDRNAETPAEYPRKTRSGASRSKRASAAFLLLVEF